MQCDYDWDYVDWRELAREAAEKERRQYSDDKEYALECEEREVAQQLAYTIRRQCEGMNGR